MPTPARRRPAKRDLKKFPLRVERIPYEGMTFLVESQEHDPAEPNWSDDAVSYPYRVELDAGEIRRPEGGIIYNGTCTCPSFNFRLHKQVTAGEVARCPHISAAIFSIHDLLMSNYVGNRNRAARRVQFFNRNKT